MESVAIAALLVMFVAVLSQRWQKIPSEMVAVLGQLGGMLAFVVLMTGLLFGVLLGGCFVTDRIISTHSLSTTDAPGFSEEKFASIKTGVAAEQVRSILGEPLRISPMKAKGQEWWYTDPKELIEGWGTWDGRYLIVSNNTVVEIYRHQIMNH